MPKKESSKLHISVRNLVEFIFLEGDIDNRAGKLPSADAMMEANVITKTTAAPIPAAVSTFLDTPRKGQIPRNWLNTTLLTNIEPKNINNKSPI